MEFLERNRVAEINQWLEENKDTVEKWVAVDDLAMFDLGEDHFVHTPRGNEGIKQCGIKEKIIKLLL